MADLDRRLAGRGLPVEREEAVGPERLQHAVHRTGLDLKAVELAPRDASPRVLPTLPERHEPEEDLPDRAPSLRVHRPIDLVGPGRERTGHAADVPIRGKREPVFIASLEELGEGVLQERRAPGSCATFAIISATRPGSGRMPTRSAGSRIACSNSSGVSGGTASVLAASSSPNLG